ncbi:MAG: GFA family protein [Deltaproteobacteria bacterium]|nr:GFA family protein [Deltaproteobacteria bacterium]
MKIEGGCYCKEVRYESDGEIGMRAQCFCRECQYITGGDSVLIIGVPEEGFRVTKGALKGFKRSDIENGVTREFCPNCGTHMTTRAMPGMVMIKIGTLDDPSIFEGPQMAIFTCDKQAYHHVPSDIPTFEKMPG